MSQQPLLRLDMIHLSADRQVGVSSVSFDGSKLLPFDSACDWGTDYPEAGTENCVMLLYTDNDRILDRAMIDGDTWREIEQNSIEEFYEAVFRELSIDQALAKCARTHSI